MRAIERVPSRKRLDKRLNLLVNIDMARPQLGWIKAIREALGMTTVQFANRLRVSQPAIPSMEKSEQMKSISLETLERAANALDCRLVYALVPRKPLEDLVEEQARKVAKKHMQAASHSMNLEDQRVGDQEVSEQFERLVKKLVEKSHSSLWDEL